MRHGVPADGGGLHRRGRRDTFWRLLVLLLLARSGYADLVPMGHSLQEDTGRARPVRPRTRPEPVTIAGTLDLGWLAADPVAPVVSLHETTVSREACLMLADRHCSLQFCIYALLSLGLFKSAPCVWRLPAGLVHACYRERELLADSGVSIPVLSVRWDRPDAYSLSLLHAPGGDSRPEYRLGIVTSLCRDSQFTPSRSAPRGPPCVS